MPNQFFQYQTDNNGLFQLHSCSYNQPYWTAILYPHILEYLSFANPVQHTHPYLLILPPQHLSNCHQKQPFRLYPSGVHWHQRTHQQPFLKSFLQLPLHHSSVVDSLALHPLQLLLNLPYPQQISGILIPHPPYCHLSQDTSLPLAISYDFPSSESLSVPTYPYNHLPKFQR